MLRKYKQNSFCNSLFICFQLCKFLFFIPQKSIYKRLTKDKNSETFLKVFYSRMVLAREEVKGITVSTGEMEKKTEEQKENKEVQRRNRVGKSKGRQLSERMKEVRKRLWSKMFFIKKQGFSGKRAVIEMICERKISIKSRIMWCLDIYRNATQLLKQSGKEFVQG